MVDNDIRNEYFEWLFDIVCEDYENKRSYRKLLMELHSRQFIPIMQRDENRAGDGISLRRRFTLERGYDDILPEFMALPCSILEMMIGLATRCEENIMDNPEIGDRRGYWFWSMVASLGLGSMSDSKYNRQKVSDILNRFIYRKYEPNGKGGLFTILNCPEDLRNVEIWVQLCWYLDNIR